MEMKCARRGKAKVAGKPGQGGRTKKAVNVMMEEVTVNKEKEGGEIREESRELVRDKRQENW